MGAHESNATGARTSPLRSRVVAGLAVTAVGSVLVLPVPGASAVPLEVWNLEDGLEAVQLSSRDTGTVEVFGAQFLQNRVRARVSSTERYGVDTVWEWSPLASRQSPVLDGGLGEGRSLSALYASNAMWFVRRGVGAQADRLEIWASYRAAQYRPYTVEAERIELLGERFGFLEFAEYHAGQPHPVIKRVNHEGGDLVTLVNGRAATRHRNGWWSTVESPTPLRERWSLANTMSGTTQQFGTDVVPPIEVRPFGHGVVFVSQHQERGRELFYFDPGLGSPELLTNHHDVNAANPTLPRYSLGGEAGGRFYYSVNGHLHSVGTEFGSDRFLGEPVEGAAAGWTMRPDLVPAPSLGEKVLLVRDDGQGVRRLYVTGVDGQVRRLSTAQVRSDVVVDPAAEVAWFTAFTPTAGEELWRTDGTPEGTRRITDLQPGPARGAMEFADGLRVSPLGHVLLGRARTGGESHLGDVVVVRPDRTLHGPVVTASARQRRSLQWASVRVRVGAAESVTARLSGTVKVPGRAPLTLPALTRGTVGDFTTVASLRVSKRHAPLVRTAVKRYRSAPQRLKAKRAVVVTVNVRLRDDNGNTVTRTRKIRLV